MALTERLQILVTADAKGAAREFDKIGASADKNLGRAETRLDKASAGLTSFGTQTLLAAGVVGAGLFKVAESASAYGEQVSRASKTFGNEALPALEEFAKGAADTAGISQTAALNAASAFSGFGRQIGKEGESLAQFSAALVQSAGDFASFADVTSEEALTIFQSTLAGETEAIRRYGIDVSAAALEQEALSQGVKKSSAEMTEAEKITYRLGILNREGALWAGDFADTSDSLANRQRNLAAEFENVKVALGEGLLPFAETAIGAISGLGEAFNGLGEENQELVGTIAGWATVGAGVVGAMSLVAGQAIKMRGAFVGADGSLNTLGKSAKYATGALAVLAATDLTLGFVNNVTGALDDASDAVNRLVINVGRGTGDITQDFVDLAAAQSDIARLGNIWESFGRSFKFEGQNMGIAIENVDRAFEEVLKSSPAVAQAIVDDFKRQADAADEGSQRQKDYQELYDRFLPKVEQRKSLDIEATKAQKKYNDEVADAAGLTADLGEEVDETASAVGDLAGVLEDAVEPLFGLADAQKGYRDALTDIEDAQRDVDEARREVNASAEEEADRLRDIEDAARDVDDAYRSLFDAQRNLLKERRDLARIDEDLAEANAELAKITPGTVEYDDQAEEVKNLTRRREDAAFSLESALLREEDAQRGIQDALRDQADTYRDVNEAKSEGSDAARDLADAEANLYDKKQDLASAAADLDAEILKVAEGFLEADMTVGDAADALQAWAEDKPPEVKAAVDQMLRDLFPLLVVLKQIEETTAGLNAENVPFRGGTNIFGQPNQYGVPTQNFNYPNRGPAAGFGGPNQGPANDQRFGIGSTAGGGAVANAARRWWDENYGGGRAMGGRIDELLYMVNERGAELFAPDQPGFVMNASDTSELISGVQDLLNPQSVPQGESARLAATMESLVAQVNQGRSGTVIEQGAITVVSPRPEEAAVATVRKMRSSEFLAGGVR